MFKIATNPTFTHRVDVQVPSNGGHDKQSLQATFRILPASETEKFDLSTVEGSTAFLHAAVVELGDLVGDDGSPQPWNDALRDQLLDVPFLRAALSRAYFTAVNKAATGN